MKNKSKIIALAGLLLAAPIALTASKIKDHQSTEKLGLSVNNLEICHQGNWRTMTFNFQYQADPLGASNQVGEVRNFVHQFLENYPNTKDFWEVMNTKLVLSLAEKFPDIKTLQSKLAIAADKDFSFPRESTVYYTDESGIVKESFRFTKLNYLICNETFKSIDFHVVFDFKKNPIPSDYPDYQWIDQAMEEFFAKNPISFSKWEETKPKLKAFLNEKFPTLTCIDVEISAAK